MPGKTVSSRFDEDLASLLEDVSKADGHAPSRIASSGARTFLSMSPHARLVAITMEGAATQGQRDFLARFVNHAALLPYRAILEERNLDRIRKADRHEGTNTDPNSENDIEADAARLCSMKRPGPI